MFYLPHWKFNNWTASVVTVVSRSFDAGWLHEAPSLFNEAPPLGYHLHSRVTVITWTDGCRRRRDCGSERNPAAALTLVSTLTTALTASHLTLAGLLPLLPALTDPHLTSLHTGLLPRQLSPHVTLPLLCDWLWTWYGEWILRCGLNYFLVQ